MDCTYRTEDRIEGYTPYIKWASEWIVQQNTWCTACTYGRLHTTCSTGRMVFTHIDSDKMQTY